MSSTDPTSRSPRWPSELRIRLYWSTTDLPGRKGFDSPGDLMEPGVCFACGFSASSLDRCHIFPRVKGGPDTVENLHMLCKVCHKDSEYLEGEAYWSWFWERTAPDMLMSRAARSGLNLWSLMNDPVIAGDRAKAVRMLSEAYEIAKGVERLEQLVEERREARQRG